MATVSPALVMPFPLGSGSLMGQGSHPEFQLRISTADATVDPPDWRLVPLTTSKLRSYAVKRGRNAELEQVPAAELQAVVDNNDRAFDPTYSGGPYQPALRPGNKIWLRALFSGGTYDRFVGDVSSYTQRWPSGGHDAETQIDAADAIQKLSRAKLPVMDPPTAQSYKDVVKHDQPSGYWSFDEPASEEAKGDPGPDLVVSSSASTFSSPGAILGDNGWFPQETQFFGFAGPDSPLAPNGLTSLSVEFWVRLAGNPGAESNLIVGPAGATHSTYFVSVNTSRQLQMFARNSAGTTFGSGVSTALNLDTWYHAVGLVDSGGVVRLYLDGTFNTSSGTFSGAYDTIVSDTATFSVNADVSGAAVTSLDEVAFYRFPLTAARILAHWQAGTQRGYRRADTPGGRVGYVLDDVSSHAPRNIQVSSRTMLAEFKHGQPPIQELREAERMELADGLLFVTRGGTLTFLDNDHRSSAPYNTVQATFGEAGGSELGPRDVRVDYSNSFLVNRWDGQADGRVLQTVSDANSIDANDEYAEQVTGLQTYDDAQVLTIVTALLAKTKDPMHRIVGLDVNTGDPDTCEALLRLDIGDRIRVLWTPPAGGSRIDQTSFVQSISETASRDDPRVFFQIGVTPL